MSSEDKVQQIYHEFSDTVMEELGFELIGGMHSIEHYIREEIIHNPENIDDFLLLLLEQLKQEAGSD